MRLTFEPCPGLLCFIKMKHTFIAIVADLPVAFSDGVLNRTWLAVGKEGVFSLRPDFDAVENDRPDFCS